MENESDELWRLESQLFGGSVQESLKALARLNNLYATQESMVLALLGKTFQSTSNILLRYCIVDILKRNFNAHHEVEDWKKFLQHISQDLFSNYYKLRMTSLECIAVVIDKLDTQYDIYHLTFDAFMQAQEEVEVDVAFRTLRLLNRRYFQSSFMKKLDRLDQVTQHKHKKLQCVLLLIKENELQGFQLYAPLLLDLFQVNVYGALTRIQESLKPISADRNQLLLTLHYLDLTSRCEYTKLAQQLFEEVLLTPQFEVALAQQSQCFTQSFFLVMLKVLHRMPNKQLPLQKDKLVNFIHGLRDVTRGIHNLHNLTLLQRLIPSINVEWGISIEVKQNIFTLESKQYSQQSILIDEFFAKLIRLFQTDQVFQPDFLINKTQLIDSGYQNIDKCLSDSLTNFKKVMHNSLFVSTQFLYFLSHLLELIVCEKLSTQGRNKKLQEQILFLNKLMSKYTLECYRILFDHGAHYKKFNQLALKKFTSQLIYLQYEIQGSFFMIENRDLALQDIITEKSHNYLMEHQKKVPFYFWCLIAKISMNFGCPQQSQQYLAILKSTQNSLHFDTYLDYLQALNDYVLSGTNFAFLLEMNQFQSTSQQMAHRNTILTNYDKYFRALELVKISHDPAQCFTHLAELEQLLANDQTHIQQLYGSAYSIDCYAPVIAALKTLLAHFAVKFGLHYETPPTQHFNQSSWIGLRLILSQEIKDLPEFVSQLQSFSQRVPKLLIQIKQLKKD